MSERRAIPAEASAELAAYLRDLERRVYGLETRRVRLGDWYLEQTASGDLQARHADSRTVTIIATP